MNIYTKEELKARKADRLNPPALTPQGKGASDVNPAAPETQYAVITSGAKSKSMIKKAVKVKAKAKAKAKPKAMELSKVMKKALIGSFESITGQQTMWAQTEILVAQRGTPYC